METIEPQNAGFGLASNKHQYEWIETYTTSDMQRNLLMENVYPNIKSYTQERATLRRKKEEIYNDFERVMEERQKLVTGWREDVERDEGASFSIINSYN